MDIDRRDFVKGAAVAGAAAAMMGVAGCAPAGQGSSSSAVAQANATSGGTATNAASSASSSSSASATPASMTSTIKTTNSTPGGSKVYYTDDISAAGLLAVYKALGFSPTGKVAVKLHMGEEGNANYLDPGLLRQLVEEVRGTFVDTTVLYGKRSTPTGYYEVAADHGFGYAPVDILDETGGMKLPVVGGSRLTEAELGAKYADYQSWVSVAHFKGHGMAGFGGTFKNLAIGLATVPQKRIVHGPSFDTGAVFLERVVDVAKAVFDDLKGRMACVNVINNLSLDCDCDSSAGAPVMADIGVLASLDPVALDRASLDQIYLSDDPGKDSVISRIESHDGAHLLDYAESLGLGSQTYELVAV